MVILFFAAERVAARKFFHRLIVFFSFGVGTYGVGTSWVHNSFRETGDVSTTVTLWVTALFVCAAATVFAAIFVAIQEIWPRRPRFVETSKRQFTFTWNDPTEESRHSVFSTALAWIVFELHNTLVQYELAFPWLQAGYAFIDTWLVGFATVGGVTLVSSLALVTAMVFYRIQRIRLITMVLGVLPWVFGFGLLHVQWTQPLEYKEVALVQSNLTISEKVINPTHSWLVHTSLSFVEEEVDYVIWPEAAIHSRLNQEIVDALYSLAARLDASVIVGMYGETFYKDDDSILHNVAIGVSESSVEHNEYVKVKMVPFGEYIPLEQVLRPVMEWLNLPTSDLRPGTKKPENMILDDVNVGMSICYEIAFPSYIAARSKRANFLVTISEDGWFGNSIGPAQHMQIARMRALETGRYVARATTKGISGIIDPKGKLVATIPANESGVVRGTIQTVEGETWFVRYLSGLTGWIWGVFALLGGGLLSTIASGFIASYGKRIFFKDSNEDDEDGVADESEESEEGVEVDEEES